MRFYDADAVQRALPMPELLDAVEDAYRAVASGRDASPVRASLPLGDGDMLVMPGVLEGAAGATVKIVTVMAHNQARGLPTVQAMVAWLDARTGTPLAVLDGAAVTAMRTGAASGVATRLLARPDAAVLGLIGAGAQAIWQVRAVLAARPIREVRIHARGAAGRAALAERLADELGSAVRVVDAPSAEAAVRGADVICCATTSSVPVFDADWVEAGAHVNGIGAFRLDMVELPPGLFARAHRVVVDSLAAARAEAGDLAAAIAAGFLSEEQVTEVGTVDREWAKDRPAGAITVFKSVGLAAQDVAAASVAMRNVRPAG
jgi:ornithine cyclodeaminase/alanine dehydrogenase-like protein (mu-crystallin family)